MKKTLLLLVSLASAASVASASDAVTYIATGNPGANPDGIDQNSNPVQVWTVTTTPGGLDGANDGGAQGSGVYYGNPDGAGGIGGAAGNAWQAYSYDNAANGNNGTALGGSVNAVHTFTGGALAVGQTVSLDFVMRATDPAANGFPAGQVGVSLLNASGSAVTFYIFGGGPGTYFYTDAGSTAASAGSMGYQYQSAFNIAFTVTGNDTYSAVAGSDTWSGTFNGSLTGIEPFNDAGGNASDVGWNNLTISPLEATPEPSTLALLGAGGLTVLAGYRRRSQRA